MLLLLRCSRIECWWRKTPPQLQKHAHQCLVKGLVIDPTRYTKRKRNKSIRCRLRSRCATRYQETQLVRLCSSVNGEQPGRRWRSLYGLSVRSLDWWWRFRRLARCTARVWLRLGICGKRSLLERTLSTLPPLLLTRFAVLLCTMRTRLTLPDSLWVFQ